MINSFYSLILDLVNHISSSYFAIFIIMALESTSIPILVPAEAVLLIIGSSIFKGSISWSGAILSSITGSVVGAILNYFLAKMIGRSLLYKYGKFMFLPVEKVQRLEAVFLKKSDILTFVGRIMPFIKHIIAIPAGLCNMPFWRFLFFTYLGSSILCVSMISVGYFFGSASKSVKNFEIYIFIGLSIMSTLLYLTYIFYDKYVSKLKNI